MMHFYVTENATNCSTTKSGPDSDAVHKDLEFMLEMNLNQIIQKYTSFVDQVLTRCYEKQIRVERLRLYSMRLFPLKSEARKELKKAGTIDDIFTILGENTSFLKCELYYGIIDNFALDENEEIFQYSQFLKDYINKHKLSEIIEINPKLKAVVDMEAAKTAVTLIKLDISSTTPHLTDVVDIVKSVAGIIGLNPSEVKIADIKDGCVMITLHIPADFANSVFTKEKKFTVEEVEKFRALSVMWIESNGHVYKFEKHAGKISIPYISYS